MNSHNMLSQFILAPIIKNTEIMAAIFDTVNVTGKKPVAKKILSLPVAKPYCA